MVAFRGDDALAARDTFVANPAEHAQTQPDTDQPGLCLALVHFAAEPNPADKLLPIVHLEGTESPRVVDLLKTLGYKSVLKRKTSLASRKA
jgi:hypothetical protein